MCSTLQPKYVFVRNSSPVTAICFVDVPGADGNDGCLLLSGEENGFICGWDLVTYKQRFHFQAHGKRIVRLVCPEGLKRKVVSQSKDGFLHLLDWESTSNCFSITKSIGISPISLCRMDATLYSGSLVICVPDQDTELALYSDGRKLKLQADCKGIPMSCKIFQHNTTGYLVIGNEAGYIRLFEICLNDDCCRKLSVIQLYNDIVSSLDYDPILNKGLAGSADERIVIWTLEEPSKITKSTELCVTNKGISAFDIRADQKIFGAISWDGRVRIFGWKKCNPLAVIDYHHDNVECLKFSRKLKLGSGTDHSEGYFLVLGSKDRTISIWSLYNQ